MPSFNLTDAQVVALRELLEILAANPAAEPAPAPAPMIPLGAPDPAITFKVVGNTRVDDVMPAGTPGTMTMPITGHVLSLPTSAVAADGTWLGTPGSGEGLIGYCERVCRQCGWDDAVAGIAQAGGIQALGSQLPAAGRTVASWPAMADNWYNLAKYSKLSTAEQAAIQASWDDVEARMKAQK